MKWNSVASKMVMRNAVYNVTTGKHQKQLSTDDARNYMYSTSSSLSQIFDYILTRYI